MFEDSTFESTGRIKTRSRRWMIATFSLNGSILITLILIPLVFPDALPHQAMPFLVLAPTTPPTQPPPPSRPTASRAFHGVSEMSDGQIHAPSAIPSVITVFKESEPAIATTAFNREPASLEPAKIHSAVANPPPLSTLPKPAGCVSHPGLSTGSRSTNRFLLIRPSPEQHACKAP